MGRRYVRDNRGRFASTGATARGGRLKTESGGKRETQTMRSRSAPGGTISRTKRAKAAPSTAKPAAASPSSAKSRGQRLGGANQKLEFQRLYHGTSKSAADSIRQGGFKASDDGFLGKGVYFSSSKKVAGYYKSVAEGKTGAGSVLAVRVPKAKVSNVKQDSFFVASKAAKTKAQKLTKQGKVAKLQAADDIQKVVLTNERTANRGLVRSSGTIRRRRR